MPIFPEHIDIPAQADAVIRALEDAGFESWVVGGFVRDSLLGREPADLDIATRARWPQARDVCAARGWSVHETGAAHGTITVVAGGRGFEVTTFRADGRYDDARHPSSVSFVRTIEEDLARRDFTVNALAYHPDRGLLDAYGGLSDLRAGIIRAVGDPAQRFHEDALRTLRGCRFVAELGFRIDPATWRGMYANKGLLGRVSTERIRHELYCLLEGPFAGRALVETADVLCAVLPELVAMKGFEQHSPYHVYDVLEHTARVVDGVPPYRLVRWAALFHDMGKPATFFTDEAGVGHFYGHPDLSMRMAAGVMGRLGMPQQFARRVMLLVQHHDDRMPPTRRNVRRELARLDGDLELARALFELQRADALAQAPQCAPRAEAVDELARILEEIAEGDDAFTVKGLAIGGADVMALGVPEGPEVGAALQAALEAVIDERVENEKAQLRRFVAQWAAANADARR